MTANTTGNAGRGWRERARVIVFESDTRAGRLFDLWLMAAISLSVVVVILDSVAAVAQRHGHPAVSQVELLL